MKIIAQTDHYITIKTDGGNQGHGEWNEAMRAMMNQMEDLRAEGYRPLHYNPRLSAWVCEKVGRASKKAA